MKKYIIPKFIFQSWLKTFFVFFSILIIIVSAAEIITALLDQASLQETGERFLYKMPGFISKIFPVNCLLASLFSLNAQKSSNELTAILSSGFSISKYVLIVIGASSIIAILQFLLMGFIEPNIFKYKYSKEISPHLLKKEGKFLARSFLGTGRTWYKNRDYFISFEQYLPSTQTLKNIELFFYKDGKISHKIKSDKAQYLTEEKTWKLKGSTHFKSLDTKTFSSYEEHKDFLISLKEVPEDFKIFESDIKTFDFLGLYQFIKKLQDTGIERSSYIILFFEKISLTLICIIFAFFPLVGLNNPNKRSSSMGKSIFFTFSFAIFYWLGQSTFANLGVNQRIPAEIATFIMPILVLLGLGFYWKRQAQ